MLRRETFSYLKLTFYVPTTSFYDVYIVHYITVISDFYDVISMHVYMERPEHSTTTLCIGYFSSIRNYVLYK